jgi:hypothetical protein
VLFRLVIIILFLLSVHVYAQENEATRVTFLSKVDTLDEVIQNPLQAKIDSLNPQQKINPYSRKLDFLQTKLSSKLDSLNALQIKDTTLTKQLTKLRSELDSIKTLGPAKDIKQAQERVAAVEGKLAGKVKNVEGKANVKMKLFSENGGNVPGGLNLPEANLSSSLNLGQALNIPRADLPDVNLSGGLPGSLGNVEVPDLGVDSDLGNEVMLPNARLADIKGLENAGKVQEQLGGLSEVGNQAKEYQDDLKEFKEGDLSNMEKLPGHLESKVENLDQVKNVQKEIANFEAIKKKWNDPEVMKEEALNKAKETAVNHFAGHEAELKAVMEKMSKLKGKIPDPEEAIDLFAKRQQFMKSKPIIERFVPGLTFQIQKNQSLWLDLNPQIGFKISGRWLTGLGWNERLAYDFNDQDWTRKHRIYGIRSFLHFKLKDSFWLKADGEYMNAPLRAKPHISSEIIGRGWVWSYFAGIKKDFQFSRRCKANVQTLYNVYNPEKKSPYTNRFNIRMGFEWSLRREEKIR